VIVRPERGAGSSGPARRRTARRVAALACAPAILLALPGCSFSTGSDSLDTDKLEREVVKGIKEQLNIDATVTCPDDVKAEAGDVFTCEARSSDGTTATVTVTQKDDDGNVDWRIGGGGTSTTPGQTTTTP
jgi:hypothetical protein